MTFHRAEIEAANEAICDAENKLQQIVGDIEIAPRAEKAEVSEVVRAAFSKLKAARAKLVDLEKLVVLAKIDAAKVAIEEAEQDLDRVINEIVVAARPEKSWVTDAVEQAFAKLGDAKKSLVELGESLPTEKD